MHLPDPTIAPPLAIAAQVKAVYADRGRVKRKVKRWLCETAVYLANTIHEERFRRARKDREHEAELSLANKRIADLGAALAERQSDVVARVASRSETAIIQSVKAIRERDAMAAWARLLEDAGWHTLTDAE